MGARLDREAPDHLAAVPALNEFGLPKRNPLQAVGIDGGYVKASDDSPDHIGECLRTLRSAKAYLWHGSAHRALHTIEDVGYRH